MNRDRLQMVVDAMRAGEVLKRPFAFATVIRNDDDSPCGFAGCAIMDTALYPPAQALGWAISGLATPYVTFDGRMDSFIGMEAFLKASSVSDCEWITQTFGSHHSYGVTRMVRVTRDMVIARIEAKIAEIDAYKKGPTIPI